MNIPSRDSFEKGLKEFEDRLGFVKGKIITKAQDSRKAHPVLDQAIHSALPFLPSPFNEIANQIYDIIDDKEIATETILKVLHRIKNSSEENYIQIVNKVNNIKNEMVTQDQVLQIMNLLTKNESPILQKLDKILDHRRIEETPILNYNKLLVKETFFPQNGRKVKVLDYLIRISKTGGAGIARDCQVFIDIPNTEVRSFPGIWVKNGEEYINIGWEEDARLFQILHSYTPPSIFFWAHGSGKHFPENDNRILNSKLIVKVQSVNAQYPSTPIIILIKDIISQAVED